MKEGVEEIVLEFCGNYFEKKKNLMISVFYKGGEKEGGWCERK